MQWRFLPFERYDPYLKMGFNKTAMERVKEGSDPIFWLTGWGTDCINVGFQQKIANVIDLNTVRANNVPVVRRQGEGGAVYLTHDGQIAWGVAAPKSVFEPGEAPESSGPNRPRASHPVSAWTKVRRMANRNWHRVVNDDTCGNAEKFGQSESNGEGVSVLSQVGYRIESALQSIGINANHNEGSNDVIGEEGKISGMSGWSEDGVVYVGGTILYQVDIDTMFTYLTPNDKTPDEYEAAVSSVQAESNASFKDVLEALRDAFLAHRSSYESIWSMEERVRAEVHAKHYRSDAWLYRNRIPQNAVPKTEWKSPLGQEETEVSFTV